MSEVIPHQLTTNVKFLHKVALMSNGKVLLLQRAANAMSRPGCWDLPGGNSEWPAQITTPTADLHAQDVSREIREETGFIVPEGLFTGQTPVFFRSFFEPDKQLYSVICGWAVALDTQLAITPDQVILSPEHTAFAWVDPAELTEYDFGGSKGVFITETITKAFAHVSRSTTPA